MEYINMDKRFKISKILIRNFIFLLLFASTVIHYADAFGFDSASSCSPNGKLSRRGRAQMIAAIPCDLTRQAYCHLPGSAYPWHAVRRFVHENQGLMKRMYGDVRHISVLRDEILNNEIDVDDVEMAAERYSKDGHKRTAKFMNNRDDSIGGSGAGNGGAIKTNDVLIEPHFRPVSTTPSTTSTTTTTPSPTTSSTTASVDQLKKETTTRTGSNYGSRGSINRRRINITRRPEVGDRVRTQTNKPPNKATTTAKETFKENFEPKLKTNEQSSQSDESTLDSAETVEADDGNLASNSVYEVPPTSAQTIEAMGDNIEIIESPQLGLGLHNVTHVEPATISATLKSATTADTETAATATAVAATPTTVQKRPLVNRQRPTQQQQQQQQQVNKVNSSIAKESSNSKSKVNESERIPSTSSPAASAVTVKGSSTTTAAAASVTTTTTTATITAAAAPQQKVNTYKKNNKNHYSNNNSSPTEPTSTSSSTTTITNALTSSLASSLLTAQLSSTLASHASSFTPLLPLKPNVELLSGEKLQKQPTSSTATPAPIGSAATKPVVLRDGQLFQDTLKQEPIPSANVKGINACPVKEEVVAPFWANNTRGEVLALLNLYPFEQYVHWEKCTHEHKQMYCRDGCRCEQQYRLHRLLAYDPHNECRGIFSDWFRFPSCCICKCYGIPMEFRATSRSPRSERGDNDEDTGGGAGGGVTEYRHPIDVAEDEVKRAIYEHATEDWYRPKDEFDFYEG